MKNKEKRRVSTLDAKDFIDECAQSGTTASVRAFHNKVGGSMQKACDSFRHALGKSINSKRQTRLRHVSTSDQHLLLIAYEIISQLMAGVPFKSLDMNINAFRSILEDKPFFKRTGRSGFDDFTIIALEESTSPSE